MKNFRIFIMKSNAMSIIFGYFAVVNLYYQQHIAF